VATNWKSYEEVATYLLNQVAKDIGLSRVEGPQAVEGVLSGTTWSLDAKGVREGDEGFVIVECRCYTTSKQNQEKIAGLAWRIKDTGAHGGIVVSPMGLQSGAQKVAAAANIVSVELDPNCTPQEFCMRFLNLVFVGIHSKATISDRYDAEVLRKCKACGMGFTPMGNEGLCPACASNV
jgi:hypothetical protein